MQKDQGECRHMLLKRGVMMMMDDYLIRHPQVFDCVSTNVRLWYAPEAIAILQVPELVVHDALAEQPLSEDTWPEVHGHHRG